MPEKLLAFDPSSSCTGWALGLRDGRDLQVCQADLLRPPSAYVGWLRVRWMASAARTVIAQCKPDQIIIEVADGKVRKGKAGAGLSVYGAAVGAIDNECTRAAFTVAVTPGDWVGNFPKSKRPIRAVMLWPGYAAVASKDKVGKDIADAVCLLDYFVQQLAREDMMRLVK